MINSIDAVLFDLDGTLLDTANDLGTALNALRQQHQLKPLPLESIRSAAGRGCKGLLKIGFNMLDDHPDYLAFCNQLLDYYQKHLFDTTQLFPGMENVLTYLESKNIPWGIVTNKPKKFTQQLVLQLQLHTRAKCIISGDSLTNRKPHPEPILHACHLLQKKPENCLYIGDSEVDMIAAQAAGATGLAALYGYIPTEEEPLNWNAEGYIQHPLDIIDWIEKPLHRTQ